MFPHKEANLLYGKPLTIFCHCHLKEYELFYEDKTLTETVESTEVVELPSSEELAKKAQEEEEEARKKAEEEERKRQEEEEARRNAVMVSASGYISKPGMGFEVTTDNKTYTLGDGDFNIVAGVVACEASGKDDALAVMSVILNRADNNGISPVNVVAAPGQFSCYNLKHKYKHEHAGEVKTYKLTKEEMEEYLKKFDK